MAMLDPLLDEHLDKPLTGSPADTKTHRGFDDETSTLGDALGSDHAQSKDSEDLPAWADLKTKAGKDRKRLPLACIACRRKKIRCSGEKPACKHCVRSRIPCIFKVTTRKAAPRTDYMALLDRRLRRMEDRVIKTMSKDDQRNTARTTVKPSLPNSVHKKRSSDQDFARDISEWSHSQTAPLANLAMPPQSTSDQTKEGLMFDGAESLPSMDVQLHLAEVYFDFVYGQAYHLLHRPTYMRKLRAGRVSPVLNLTICAIAARFSTLGELQTEPAYSRGEQWAKPARDIALRYYDTPNLTIIMVYTLLGLHEFGTCHGGRSWMFGGMAQRMAYALQLHKDLDHDTVDKNRPVQNRLTHTDREVRRRTMWACFMMDRFNSSGTERPPFVAQQYVEAQLPIKESMFQNEVSGETELLEEPDSAVTAAHASDLRRNMGCAAYEVRAISIWGNVIRYFNLGGKEKDAHPMWSDASEFHQLMESIDVFRERLPPELHWNEENLTSHANSGIANQFIFLHIIQQQLTLFLTRFALPMPGSPVQEKNTPQGFLSKCIRLAVSAANQTSVLIDKAMDHRVVAPFAGYSAFFSSTVHIHGLLSKSPAIEHASRQALACNIKYLIHMKQYWGMFHFVTEHLKDLYRQQVAARNGRPGATSDSPGTIFQYGDWFARYPHGCTESSASTPERANNEAAASGKMVDKVKTELGTTSSRRWKRDHKRKRTRSIDIQTDSGRQSPAIGSDFSFNGSQSANSPVRPQLVQHRTVPEIDMNNSPKHALTDFGQSFGPRSQPTRFVPNALPFLPDIQQGLPSPQTPTRLAPEHQSLAQQNQQMPGVMSRLDRQMVLSSYAGEDTIYDMPPIRQDQRSFGNRDMVVNQGNQNGIVPDFASFDPTMPGASGGMNAQQLGGLDQGTGTFGGQSSNGPSSGSNGLDSMENWNSMGSGSWFVPFNVAPPSGMPDDAAFLGNGPANGNLIASDFGAFGFDASLAGMPGGFGSMGGSPMNAQSMHGR